MFSHIDVLKYRERAEAVGNVAHTAVEIPYFLRIKQIRKIRVSIVWCQETGGGNFLKLLVFEVLH